MTVAALRKTVILARVSTTHQSPDAQVRALKEFAAREGIHVHAIVNEGQVSGALDEAKRPKLAALMAAVAKGRVGTLLVAEWSRLGRDTLSQLNRALRLQEAGVRVLVLDDAKRYDLDDPDDLLLFFLLVWKDHRARIDTKKRTKRAFVKGTNGKAHAVRSGKPSGRRGLRLDDGNADLLRHHLEQGRTAKWIAVHGNLTAIETRDVDFEGSFCSVSKLPVASRLEVPVCPSYGAVKRLVREARAGM